MAKEKECYLTEEQFKKILEMCMYSDDKRRTKAKPYLVILLKLMYYCHLPLIDALGITPYQVNGPNEEVPGWYDSEDTNSRMVFEIPDFFYKELCDYQKTYNIEEDFSYIGRSDRGVRGQFQKITEKLGYGAVQLKEVKKLGEKNYTSTCKPYKYEEDR